MAFGERSFRGGGNRGGFRGRGKPYTPRGGSSNFNSRGSRGSPRGYGRGQSYQNHGSTSTFYSGGRGRGVSGKRTSYEGYSHNNAVEDRYRGRSESESYRTVRQIDSGRYSSNRAPEYSYEREQARKRPRVESPSDYGTPQSHRRESTSYRPSSTYRPSTSFSPNRGSRYIRSRGTGGRRMTRRPFRGRGSYNDRGSTRTLKEEYFRRVGIDKSERGDKEEDDWDEVVEDDDDDDEEEGKEKEDKNGTHDEGNEEGMDVTEEGDVEGDKKVDEDKDESPVKQANSRESKTPTQDEEGDEVAINKDSSPKKKDSETTVHDKDSKPARMHIQLQCPHCSKECRTFSEYSMHLSGKRHLFALNDIGNGLRMTVNKLRNNQRKAQNELEASQPKTELVQGKASFCLICKLSHKHTKEKHRATEFHKKLRKIMLPVCHICQLAFKSPMVFEKHMCSLSHIKRKAYTAVEEKAAIKKDTDEGDNEDGIEGLDMSNFMTLDEVGDDDEEMEDVTEEGEKDGETVTDGESKKGAKKERKDRKSSDVSRKRKLDTSNAKVSPKKEKIKVEELSVGESYVENMTVLFCKLCDKYLPRTTPIERVIKYHCSSKFHRRFFHEKEQKKRREKRQREEYEKRKALQEELEEKEKKATPLKDENKERTPEHQKTTEPSSPVNLGITDEVEVKKPPNEKQITESIEKLSAKSEAISSTDAEPILSTADKLWDDMDRDLGELLKEAEADGILTEEPANEEEEDEDGEEKERFDRLKNSDNKGDNEETVESTNSI